MYQRNDTALNRFTGCVVRSPTSPWAGLIAHLHELCGGNVHREGCVEITCSSTVYNSCSVVVDYDASGYWVSNDLRNSWIQFDFKDRIVSLNDYALKSDGNCNHLLEWTLHGSMDMNSWTVLDSQSRQDPTGDSTTKIFPCGEGTSPCRFYRYIRLTQTGKASSGTDSLMLVNLEFFGLMMNSSSAGFLSHPK